MFSSSLHLHSLSLNNFATFENQFIEFNDNFNAIIGETGSGKSLILDALQMVFGHRADKKLIRKGSEFSTIEAVFTSCDPNIQDYFNSIGHPFENNEVVIKRIIYASGKSKTYLNYQSCPLSLLNSFSKKFIDLVGQFDNQKLLSEEYQLTLLDSFAGLSSKVIEYKVTYESISSFSKQLKSLQSKQSQMAQREDYLKFQLSEIESLDPSLADEEDLILKKDRVMNFEKRQGLFDNLLSLLSDGDVNILSQLKLAINLSNKDVIIGSEEINKLSEAYALIEDCSYNISKELSTDHQDESIEEIISRLDSYQILKRKFGGTTASIIEHHNSFENELNSLMSVDQQIIDIQNSLIKLTAHAHSLANKLHKERVRASLQLSKELTLRVRSLKMEGATTEIKVSKLNEINGTGFSDVSFFAETNPGEGYYKIKEIASGGELSRILLSLRQILATNDSISIFLFDEIDTGIGGETALCIGKALEEVSKQSQVIAITHLPQIATYAQKLVSVSKSTINNRTISSVDVIVGNKRSDFVVAMAPIN